jgi:acyl-CoA thioesterase FadM
MDNIRMKIPLLETHVCLIQGVVVENMLVIHLALSQIGNVRVVLVQNIKIRVIILELLVLNITNVLKASMDPLM